MKKNRMLLVLIVLLLGRNTVLAEGLPKQGGRLIIGQNADAVTLDPARLIDSESANVTANIFEGLVRYHDDSTEVEPALAVAWETSADGKEWIFHLRQGVFFHDSTPFNADAVVFSILRQIDPLHPYYRRDFAYADSTFRYVMSVEALDTHTVKIGLREPYAPFLYNLAISPAAPIISPAALEKWGDDFAQHPVGTGPFNFVEWIPGDRIVLEANSNYWGTTPFLEELIFQAITNPSARFEEFRTGRIDVIDGIHPADIVKIERLPGARIVRQPGLNVAYLAMNTEKPPFDQVKVRQALNYAINKHQLIKLYYKNMAIPAKNPIPPTLWGYNDDIQDYAYDPDKARQLLQEAGYGNGFETTLWVMNVDRPYMPQPGKIARAIQGNLLAIGIKTYIISDDWGSYIASVQNGEHELCLLGWVGDNGDPDNFLYVLLDKDNTLKPKAQNVAFFKHDDLHELLIQAQQISEKQQRIELYRQAQTIIHAQAPWVPLAHTQRVSAHRENVHDVIFHPTGILLCYRAWVE